MRLPHVLVLRYQGQKVLDTHDSPISSCCYRFVPLLARAQVTRRLLEIVSGIFDVRIPHYSMPYFLALRICGVELYV